MTAKSNSLRRWRLLEIVISRYDASQSKLAAISAEISDALKHIEECSEEFRRAVPSATAPGYAPFIDRRRAALQREKTALVRRHASLQSELECRKKEFAAILCQKISLEKAIEDTQTSENRGQSRVV